MAIDIGPAPTGDYGAYTQSVQDAYRQAQTAPSIYQPQIDTLQSSLPGISKTYSDFLNNLNEQTSQALKMSLGGMDVTSGKAASAGNFGSSGSPTAAGEFNYSTPEQVQRTSAKTQSDLTLGQNTLNLTNQRDTAIGNTNSQIAQLVAAQATAQQNALGQMAAYEAQGISAKQALEEQQREADLQAQISRESISSSAASARQPSATQIKNMLQTDVSDTFKSFSSADFGNQRTEKDTIPALINKYQDYINAGILSTQDIYDMVYKTRKASYGS
jgi:hypothetical protein